MKRVIQATNCLLTYYSCRVDGVFHDRSHRYVRNVRGPFMLSSNHLLSCYGYVKTKTCLLRDVKSIYMFKMQLKMHNGNRGNIRVIISRVCVFYTSWHITIRANQEMIGFFFATDKIALISNQLKRLKGDPNCRLSNII